jgi:hypothetical protein
MNSYVNEVLDYAVVPNRGRLMPTKSFLYL